MSNPTEIQASNAQNILERVKTESGPAYWRSLDELAATPEFQARMKKEFSSQEEQWIDPVTRRNFLKLMGASLALSGLTACNIRRPNEPLVPYVTQPEGMVQGKPMFFATAMPYGGYGYPLLVESHGGRPTKVEGNADHPASLGAAFAWQQASVLSLYDPERSQMLTRNNSMRSWADFVGEVHSQVLGNPGGVRILTETVTSPSLAAQIRRVLQQVPNARWIQYDPMNAHSGRAASLASFGQAVDTSYQFENADVVLTLDSDFMMDGPGALYYSKQFTTRRRVRTTEDTMGRTYTVESTPTNTGTLSDHRLPVRASDILGVTRAIAVELGVAGALPAGTPPYTAHAKWVSTLVRDLQASRGRSIIVAGDQQPPIVHALVHSMNAALGNVGQTVFYTEPAEAEPKDQLADLRELVREMNEGAVSVLIMLGGNPAYNAPGDLNFLDVMKAQVKADGGKLVDRVPFRVHLSEYPNETSLYCHWNVPQAHFLEAWGDVRAFNGLVSIVQPLIAPLYPLARTSYDVLGAMLGEGAVSTYEIVRTYWQGQRPGEDFEKFWRRALHDGFIAGTQTNPVQVTANAGALATLTAPASSGTGYDVVFRPDPSVRDGSFANLGWLQELPKPFTKITWENVVLMSPAMAARLNLVQRKDSQFDEVDEVELSYNGRTIEAAAVRVAGHADNTVTLHLGYGRTRAGHTGGTATEPLGFDAYRLQTVASPGIGTGALIKRTGATRRIAQTQMHFALDQGDIQGVMGGMGAEMSAQLDMRNRGIVRTASLTSYRKNPNFVSDPENGPHTPARDLTLYHGTWEYKGYAWGMAIDMNVCNGCNACVVACQAENNIPVVGKEQVLLQREMHWMRIDQYYTGDPANPKVYHQPMLCQHCENAPCEYVCPVVATLHSDEGTNDMIYNRCVGTRFCANNCPYKVRRFNFFAYADFGDKNPLAKMLNNPDVTVRSRGVMEKCSFCIQRISYARQESEVDGRKIRDGEVVTACQATCPTDAIVFGNINDPTARVTQLKANSLNYGVLTDLNTRPRVTYLAKLSNENAELEDYKG